MKRRHFLHTSGLALGTVLIGKSVLAGNSETKSDIVSDPDLVTACSTDHEVALLKTGTGKWEANNIAVSLIKQKNAMEVLVDAPKTALSQITLVWNSGSKLSSTLLNDHWERTYGDVSWHKPVASEIFPWYFLEVTPRNGINGFGVKTGANSFCSWQVNENGLSLSLDTRSGGKGVWFGTRTLKAAEIVVYKSDKNSPFAALKEFLKKMCDNPRMPKQPVYGINDWYFSYGNNSEKLIIEHTEMMAPMADGLKNRPFSVIDAGWFQNPPSSPNDCCWGDNMDTPDEQFGDMGELAQKIRTMGMRPGIWTRPLCGSYKDAVARMLPVVKGREEKKPVLDPTIPENLERITGYFKQYNEWSYEMVKVDFTTYDLFGKWGFEMIADKRLTESGWTMNDNSKTNAEIVLELYKTIREAAGETCVIGCNTFSHLSAGLFELNRIGDDTSGHEWERTRKMGVNTLAFRSAHQGTFYAADGDCVGLTPKVAWAKNKQWMELLAKSGTPLFISAQPEATGAEQKAFIKECFALASQELPVGEPLDWMENAFPARWKLNGDIVSFDWG
jgi:alpha-galactosidase